MLLSRFFKAPVAAIAAPLAPKSQPIVPRAVIILVGFAAFLIAMDQVRGIANILGPTFLAATLVITAHPLRIWFVKHRVPGWLATTAVLLVLWLLLIGLIAALGFAGAKLAIELPTYNNQFNDLYQSAVDRLSDAGVGSDQIDDALSQVNYGSVFGYVQSVVSSGLSAGSTFVFLLTVMVFLVMDAAGVPARLTSLSKAKPNLAGALQSFAANVRTYWLVTSLFGAIVAILDAIALRILGVPLVLTWALLSFITNYIPNIGFVLGLIPPALLGYLDGGLNTAVGVVAVYAVLNFVVQTILQPRITGDAIGVSTTVAFLSLIFWSYILGPLGALMALPVTLFIKAILVDADPDAKWVNAFLADQPNKAE